MEKMRTLTTLGKGETPAEGQVDDEDEEMRQGKNEIKFRQSTEFTKPRLYYVNGSIPSWRVMISLHEKRIPFFPWTSRESHGPVETKEKPGTFVSELEREDASLRRLFNESLAILQYLEDYYPFSQLLLPPLRDRTLRAQTLSLVQESENLHYVCDDLEDAFWKAKANATTENNPDIFTHFVTNVSPHLIGAVEAELQHWEVYLGAALLTKQQQLRRLENAVANYITSQQRCGLRAMQRAQREGLFLVGTDYMTLANCAFYPILAFMKHRGSKIDENRRGR
ncbi:hypothetical protein VTO42DRAFT_2035 [Malbranchea cinnamomea]